MNPAPRLPSRPTRPHDETWSSWIQRVAFSNGLKVSDLFATSVNPHCSRGWPPSSIKAADLQALTRMLGMDDDTLVKHLDFPPAHTTLWFCPLCLQEQPYFRTHWTPHPGAVHGAFRDGVEFLLKMREESKRIQDSITQEKPTSHARSILGL